MMALHLGPERKYGTGRIFVKTRFLERTARLDKMYVGPGVQIGNGVKIQNNVSIYSGVLEDDVFCGSSVVFTNVKNPRSEINQKHNFQNYGQTRCYSWC